MLRQNADKIIYRGWGILVSFWVWKRLLIHAYKCSKYLDYIQFHLEVHSEVFQSIVFGLQCFNMLRNKKSLLSSLFCSLGGRGNYLVIPH